MHAWNPADERAKAPCAVSDIFLARRQPLRNRHLYNNNNNIIPTKLDGTKAGQDSTLDVVKGPLHETWLRSAT